MRSDELARRVLAAAKACNLTFATAESCTAGAEVAQAMARGILTRCSADLAVAITGVVGPEPDEDGNPVGLIYCACARRGREPHSVCLHSLQSEREAILEDGICAALGLLLAECSDQHTPPTGQKTPEWEDS